jgi:hypothetical protein
MDDLLLHPVLLHCSRRGLVGNQGRPLQEQQVRREAELRGESREVEKKMHHEELPLALGGRNGACDLAHVKG